LNVDENKAISEKIGKRRRRLCFAKSLKTKLLKNDLGTGAKNSSRPLNVDEKTGS
jgi:hypothetical protein